MKEKVLQNIKALLADNYQEKDAPVLTTLLELVITQAEDISNREITDDEKDANFKLLTPEIINATIIAYQNRGVESLKSQTELGESNTFVDYTEKLRADIIKNGKRIVR